MPLIYKSPTEESLADHDPFFLSKIFYPNGTDYSKLVPFQPRDIKNIPNLLLDYGEDPSTNSYTGSAVLPEDVGNAACEMPDPTDPNALLAGQAVNAGKIADALGLSETCKEDMITKLKIASGKGNAFATLVGQMSNKSEFDVAMTAEGCGEFSTTLDEIFSLTSTLRCQYSKLSNNNDVEIASNNGIKIIIGGANDELGSEITKITLAMQQTIAEYSLTFKDLNLEGLSDSLATVYLQSWLNGQKHLQEMLDAYVRNNPVRITVRDSTITASIASSLRVQIISKLQGTQADQIMTTIKRVANEVATENIKRSTGLDALPPNGRDFVLRHVNDLAEDRAKQIISLINQNQIKLDDNKNIVVEIYGNVEGSTISTMIDSQIDLKVETTMKSAINLGETIASDITRGLEIERTLCSEAEGISDAIKAVLDAHTERDKIGQGGGGGDGLPWSTIAIAIAVIAFLALYFMSEASKPKSATQWGKRL